MKLTSVQTSFTRALTAAMMVVVCTNCAQAKSYKKLADTATSHCVDGTNYAGEISKQEKRRAKHQAAEDRLLDQDLSGDSGPYLISG